MFAIHLIRQFPFPSFRQLKSRQKEKKSTLKMMFSNKSNSVFYKWIRVKQSRCTMFYGGLVLTSKRKARNSVSMRRMVSFSFYLSLTHTLLWEIYVFFRWETVREHLKENSFNSKSVRKYIRKVKNKESFWNRNHVCMREKEEEKKKYSSSNSETVLRPNT